MIGTSCSLNVDGVYFTIVLLEYYSIFVLPAPLVTPNIFVGVQLFFELFVEL